jgi:hypothetical protein
MNLIQIVTRREGWSPKIEDWTERHRSSLIVGGVEVAHVITVIDIHTLLEGGEEYLRASLQGAEQALARSFGERLREVMAGEGAA